MSEQKFCLLINSLTEGGAEKAVATLIPEFRQQGVEVPLICLERNDVHKIASARISYLSDHTGAGEGFIRKFISLFLFANRLKKYVRANQIRLVQSHIFRANYVNVLARLMGSRHKVQVVNHGIPEQYRKSGIAGRINHMLIRWLYPRADQVICPSRDMLNDLQKMGVAKHRLVLIPNPVDLAQVASLAAQAVAGESFRFEPGKKYCIAIGRLEPVKRTQDIIEAFAEVAPSRQGLELLILGSGSEEQQLTGLVEKLQLGHRVHLLGHVENPYQYLARSELLISASENEGFSLVIVEALALGIPVISTDCAGGPRDILAPSGAETDTTREGNIRQAAYGLFVPTHDVPALADAMTLLLDDTELQQHLADKGKERAREYDKALSASRYLQCTQQLMGAC